MSDALRRRLVPALFLLALLAPRALSLAGPGVHYEDQAYLTAAALLSEGEAPHLDFHLQHVALLEALLAVLFLSFGASVATVEITSQLALVAGSALTFRLGERLGGRPVGVVAALLFAWSPLLFRYHLFARESFVLLPVLGAALLLTNRGLERAPSRRGAIGGGLLLGLALLFKLTAVAWAGAAIVAVALRGAEGRRRAAESGLATALVAGLGLGLSVLAFGRAFLVQAVLFGALHPGFGSATASWDALRAGLAPVLWLGLPGALWLGVTARSRWALPLGQVACGLVLLVAIKPVAWPHNALALLPWLALLSAGALVRLIGAGRALHRGASGSERRRALALLGGGLALVLATAAWLGPPRLAVPCPNIARATLAAMAEAVRAHSEPRDFVAVPALVSLEAGRRDLLPYLEIDGRMDELEAAVAAEGLRATFAARRGDRGDMRESVERSMDRAAPVLVRAVQERRVAVVLSHAEGAPCDLPGLELPPGLLEGAGYRVAWRGDGYLLWAVAR